MNPAKRAPAAASCEFCLGTLDRHYYYCKKYDYSYLSCSTTLYTSALHKLHCVRCCSFCTNSEHGHVLFKHWANSAVLHATYTRMFLPSKRNLARPTAAHGARLRWQASAAVNRFAIQWLLAQRSYSVLQSGCDHDNRKCAGCVQDAL
jgi:hypothetical protein